MLGLRTHSDRSKKGQRLRYKYRILLGVTVDDGRSSSPYRAFGLIRCRWSSARLRWTTDPPRSHFQYYRAMLDAMAGAPVDDPEKLVWIMNERSLFYFAMHLVRDMGTVPDTTQLFGIPIELGEPSNGEPFELVVKNADIA